MRCDAITLQKDSCPYKVKPLPYEFCEGCVLNGCYPWNSNPFLLCSLMGGVLPVIQVTQDNEEIPRECANYKPVTEEMWASHLSDLKMEAERNEDVRKRAMRGGALSSDLMPAEKAAKRLGNKAKRLNKSSHTIVDQANYNIRCERWRRRADKWKLISGR